MATECRRIAQDLAKRYPEIVAIVAGDAGQESTPLVKMLHEMTGARLVLSPEGIGVFRSRYGGYGWRSLRVLGLLKALLLNRIPDLDPQSQVRNPQHRTKQTGLSALWRLSRIFRVLLNWRRWGVLPDTGLKSVDLVLSPWPREVNFGISSAHHQLISSAAGVTTRVSVSVGLLVYVHQPMELPQDQWDGLLQPLSHLEVSAVIVKGRVDSETGEKGLVSGLAKVLPGVSITVRREGLAEQLLAEYRPEFVVGVTSTALFTAAFEGWSPQVLSLAHRLNGLLGENAQSLQPGPFVFAHQVKAFESIAKNLIKIL